MPFHGQAEVPVLLRLAYQRELRGKGPLLLLGEVIGLPLGQLIEALTAAG